MPRQDELSLDPAATYVHITSNETIAGTQWHEFPDTAQVPLVADMSSDIMWRPIDLRRFGVIYAGAQKNLGPAGVTLVIVRKDLVEAGRTDIPPIYQYRTHAEANSLSNTAADVRHLHAAQRARLAQAGGGLGGGGAAEPREGGAALRGHRRASRPVPLPGRPGVAVGV
jgi:phosphoserine aminotransferase